MIRLASGTLAADALARRRVRLSLHAGKKLRGGATDVREVGACGQSGEGMKLR